MTLLPVEKVLLFFAAPTIVLLTLLEALVLSRVQPAAATPVKRA